MLLCFTSSHRTAGFDLLEALERDADTVKRRFAAHDEIVGGSVVLATCNRFEAYVDIDEPLTAGAAVAAEAVLAAISEGTSIPIDELRESGDIMFDGDVAEHLFAVSSGLESVVVGESEIAGQVRRSLTAARAEGTVTRELERLFQVAARTSRGVKNHTGITSAGRSIVRLALDLAESRVTDWSQVHALLIGTGTYAGAALAALRERGVTSTRVYSRTGRALTFASAHGIDAVQPDALAEAVAAADVLIACTVAPTVILDPALATRAAELPGALSRRLVIDLGLPRNVDPAVGQIAGYELLDLETISVHAPLADQTAEADARAIVGAAAQEFAAARAELDVEPALIAYRSHVFDLLDAEIERSRKRGEDPRTEAALRHLAGVLLHGPSVRARELARDGRSDEFVAGLDAVFGVQPAALVTRLEHEAPTAHVASDGASATSP